MAEKAEQEARETLTFARKAPPPEERKEGLPGLGNAPGMPPTRGAAFPWLTHSLATSRSSTSPPTPKAGSSSLPRASKETRTRFGQSAACATGRAGAPATADSQLRDWRMGRKPQARRPAGCKVPSQHRPVRSCTRDLSHQGLQEQKVGEGKNKVEGSHGEVSRAHGKVGNRAGTCRSLESWRVRLAGLGDAACPRCRDPASPRGPAPAAAAAGERVSPRGRRVRGSRPAGAGRLERRAGPGGANVSVNAPLLCAPPAAWRSALLQGSPGPGRGAALARGQMWIKDVPQRAPCTDGWTQTQQCGNCIAIQAQVQSHLGSVPPCPRGSQGHVPRLPPCARLGEIRSPAEEK